jgi:hypothetical protein
MACLVAVACGGHSEPPTPRGPLASPDLRCTLRISQRGVLVDGEPMSRADAVAYCKGTAGGAIVVIEDNAATEWDAKARAMVVIEDNATKAVWDETRAALQRERVRIYVRGPLCYDPRVLGCRPETTPEPRPEPRRRIVPAREPLSPPAPK